MIRLDSHSKTGIATGWPALIERERGLLTEYLTVVDQLPQDIVDYPDQTIAEHLLGTVEGLAEALVLFGPEGCQSFFRRLNPFMPEAFRQLDGNLGRFIVEAHSLLLYLWSARFAGCPPECHDISLSWLTELVSLRDRLTEKERQTLALVSLNIPAPDLALRFLDAPALEAPPDLAEVSGFNLFAFVRYLSAAIRDASEFPVVAPVCRGFLGAFPYKLAAQTADWADLLLAGGAVLTRFSKTPSTEVGLALNEVILRIAAGYSD
jgi:hypothetical protein